jgi:hypothetical protein
MHYLEQHKPENILATGEHEGFRWLVGHNTFGYRVGYITVPADHPWHGKGYDNINADVHGGLTYAEKGTGGASGGLALTAPMQETRLTPTSLPRCLNICATPASTTL